jgi:hypothetical protein
MRITLVVLRYGIDVQVKEYAIETNRLVLARLMVFTGRMWPCRHKWSVEWDADYPALVIEVEHSGTGKRWQLNGPLHEVHSWNDAKEKVMDTKLATNTTRSFLMSALAVVLIMLCGAGLQSVLAPRLPTKPTAAMQSTAPEVLEQDTTYGAARLSTMRVKNLTTKSTDCVFLVTFRQEGTTTIQTFQGAYTCPVEPRK